MIYVAIVLALVFGFGAVALTGNVLLGALVGSIPYWLCFLVHRNRLERARMAWLVEQSRRR